MSELLRCPFCDGEAELVHMDLCCKNLGGPDNQACGAIVRFPICSVTSHATRLWNRRPAQCALHETALRDIVSWKEDTLGPRSRKRGPYDYAPHITEAFDRGARMAFYRCAARAAEALSAVTSTDGGGK